MFLLLLLFGFSLLFWNLANSFSGKIKFVIPAFFVSATLLGFFFREITFFSAVQTFFLIFTCIALSLYIILDILLVCPKIFRRPLSLPKRKIAGKIILITSLITTTSFLIYGIPHNADYKIETSKITLKQNSKPFTVAFFTDLHLDPLFKQSKLERLAVHLDSLQPDYIFFGGDLADITDSLLNEKGIDKLMQTVTSKAKKGTFAILGNHEAYMESVGSNPANWMRHIGMIPLIDSTICTEHFCLTGRQDFHVARKKNTERTPLNNLVPMDSSLPWLLLDHQPHGIEKDYQGKKPLLALSGHTHNGQFFPGTLLIDLIWPLSYGFGNLDGVNWLVSSGIDSWGPPVRVGSDTELWYLQFSP